MSYRSAQMREAGLEGRNTIVRGSQVWRRNATTIASALLVRTVERGSFGPNFWSLTDARLGHLAPVLGSIPISRLNSESTQGCLWITRRQTQSLQLGRRALEMVTRASSVTWLERGASVESSARRASHRSVERVTPSNCGIEHPGGATLKPASREGFRGILAPAQALASAWNG